MSHSSRDQVREAQGSGSPSDNEQYEAYVGRIARGAGVGSFGQGMGRVLNYLTQVALARMFGASLLGFYVLGTTMIQASSVLAQFGMGNGLVRYIAHYRVENDVARVRGTILLVLWTAFALSTTLAAILFFGAGFLADTVFNKPEATPVFRAFAVSLPFFTMMNMVLVSTQGFQTMKYTSYVKEIQRPFLNLVFVVIFYFLGAQIVGAVIAYILSFAVGVVLSFFYLRQVFPKLLDRGVAPKFEPRAVFGASAPMVLANFAQNMSAWIVIAVLGAFATAESVGIFNVAVRTAALSTLVLGAFANIFSPMVSSLYVRGRMDDLDNLYRDVARWTFAGSLVVFLLTVLLAKDVMSVFGPEFVSGWVVMVVVATGQLINSSTGPGGRVLAMTGHHNVLMLSTIAAALITLLLSFTLIPPYGLMGAGAAAAIGLTLSNIVGLVLVRRLVGLTPYDRGHLKPLFTGILAAAVTYPIKLTLPLPAGVPTMLAVAPIFLAAFAALTLVFGLKESDRQLLASLWKAVLRKTPRKAKTQSRESGS